MLCKVTHPACVHITSSHAHREGQVRCTHVPLPIHTGSARWGVLMYPPTHTGSARWGIPLPPLHTQGGPCDVYSCAPPHPHRECQVRCTHVPPPTPTHTGRARWGVLMYHMKCSSQILCAGIVFWPKDTFWPILVLIMSSLLVSTPGSWKRDHTINAS